MQGKLVTRFNIYLHLFMIKTLQNVGIEGTYLTKSKPFRIIPQLISYSTMKN